MDIKNILIVSPMFHELQLLIKNENLAKNFRFKAEENLTEDDLEWADGLVCFHVKRRIDFSKVQWVHSLGAGVDRFLYQQQWPDHVLLTRTVCSFGQRIAEYCLSYILADVQFHNYFRTKQSMKEWSPITPELLVGKKMIIFGTGEIGQKVARLFSTIGVQVYGVSLSGSAKSFFKEVFTLESAFIRLGEMNYVVNTLPLTEKTANLFDASLFQRFSRVGFINVGRGAVVDDTALLMALEREDVRFAVLDVFSEEPLPKDHPFWSHEKVKITPHISAVTTPEEAVKCFVDTLKRMEKGLTLTNQVDVQRGY